MKHSAQGELSDVHARAIVVSTYATSLLQGLEGPEPAVPEEMVDYLQRIVAHMQAIEHIVAGLLEAERATTGDQVTGAEAPAPIRLLDLPDDRER